MSIGIRAYVADGVVERADGLNFGGRYYFKATESELEAVELSIWTEDTDAVHMELHVGETLEFSGQTWRLDEITAQGGTWNATLTRVA
jgi:hypothetical protein